MTQHEILMLVAAPLLVLGKPMIAFLRCAPIKLGASAGTSLQSILVASHLGDAQHRICCLGDSCLAIWVWHVPALFQATLHNEWVHAAKDLSFLLSAILFWWALMEGGAHAMGYGMGVLYMFTTLHSGLLGAL